MKTGNDGIHLMHYFESCKLEAYPDPATGGAPWTIGWGHTGADVYPGLEITQEKADELFAKDLEKFEVGVRKVVQGGTTQSKFDAMVCFAYNLGLGNFNGSTLLKKHNAGDYKGAADEFIRWNKANGKPMKGLSRRRQAESGVYEGLPAEESIQIALTMYP